MANQSEAGNRSRVRLSLCITAAALLITAGGARAQTTFWVDQAGGNDANNGTTEATAYASLQTAIDNSTSGTAGTPSVVNVKNGTYGVTGQVNGACNGGLSTAILIRDLDYLTIQAVTGHNPVVKPLAAANIVSVSVESSDHLIVDGIDSDQTVAQFDNWHVCDSADLTLRNSTFEGGEDGIDFNTNQVTALIEGNAFVNINTGSGDEALDFTDGSTSDVTIQDNTFVNNYRQITINPSGSTSGIVIRRNLMDGTTSEEAIRLIGAADVVIENNVIMNNLQQGVYIDNGCAAITVRHNTFFNNDQESGGNGEIRTKVLTADIVIKNNILHGNGSNPAFEAAAASLPGEDFNLIYNTVDSFTFGAGTISGDPLFVSTTAGGEDLHLTATSPAIEAGTDLGVTEDKDGGFRPTPTPTDPDIGAYEFIPPPVCGDGVVHTTEGCDDGDTASGDGCSDACVVELCYACNGQPSSCSADTGASCDNGDSCSENDTCTAQATCVGTEKDCSGSADQCNDGVCNAPSGVCEPSPVQDGTGCDDGLFCTATDTCSGGVCAGAGDPCAGLDQCSDSCNEAEDDCFDAAGTACDDQNTCTVNDQCDGAGFCGATSTLFGSACEWFGLTASDRTAKLKHKRDVTIVGGGLCADRAQIGRGNSIDGDLAATEGSHNRALHIFPSVVVTGDLVTGGGGITGGARARLPHLTPVTTFVGGGETLAKDDPPAGVYDTTGASSLVSICVQSQNEAIAAAATIAGLSSDADLGRVELDPGETLTIIPPNPGGLNVIDFERLTGATGATINVDGGASADTIVILRIERKLQLKAQSSINVVNSLDPANFVAFVTGKKLQLGNKCTATGTLYAAGLVKIDSNSIINGQVFAAGKKLQIGEEVMGTTIPNQIVLP